MKVDREKICAAAPELYEDMVDFARRLVQARSDTGHEKEVAELILAELVKLNYDEVIQDETGNIIGVLHGDSSGKNIMFNCHMDQVDPGDLGAWEHEPFAADVEDGYIHGRGASDTKGAIATQIYAGALVKKLGISLKGDLIFTFVVEEEPGDMWGAVRMMKDTLKDRRIDFSISGEATSMGIALGHRGKLEVQIISKGKNSHSSAPWLGVNAVSKMAPMIVKIDEMAKNLPKDDIFADSLSIIAIECHPGFNCVVPDTCTINIDYRFKKDESKEDILARFCALADEVKKEDPEADFEIRVRQLEHMSYRGVHDFAELNKPCFVTDINHEYVQRTIQALHCMGQDPKTYYWDFGTDAAYFSAVCGIPTIGYSPLEEKYCHAPIDRVSIELMKKALEGYAAICMEISC